ncbi:ribose-5-phosphate isomerase RpiA [Saliphagus infecundisoli]|uniref:Ribose-5-phosphate isomerase A n=1 Tax=Saliphagus infecundisoli TaxID=1849069 RepID=A0ABD5QI49_9EURY|nr:ribose-5-phosphate isomerase RpiA [Saliphagus infecundisoli]
MKGEGGSEGAKRRAGQRAAREVESGWVVGLGTGSTAAHAIRALEDADVRGIPTSYQSRGLAIEAGVPLTSLDEVEGVDLSIDGADQFARGSGALIKGGGGAHAREKIIDGAADRFLVVADPTKATDVLDRPVPVECLPDARPVVENRLRECGGEPDLREAAGKDGPVITDNGNLLIDCAFGAIEDPGGLATRLSAIPGVVEHGLFVDLADTVYVGIEEGVERIDY